MKRHRLSVARSEWKGLVTATKGGRTRHVPLTGRLEAALRQARHLCSPGSLQERTRGVQQTWRGAGPEDRSRATRRRPFHQTASPHGNYRPSIGRFVVRTPAGAWPLDRPSEHGLASRSRAWHATS